MAFTFQTKSGKKIVLLNPAEKGTRYSRQLKSGKDHQGNILTDTQKAFRSGYLTARQDSAKVYKSKLK